MEDKNAGLTTNVARLARELLEIRTYRNSSHSGFYSTLAATLAIFVATVGSTILVIWYLSQFYTIIAPGWMLTRPNIAAGLVAAGLGLYLHCVKIGERTSIKLFSALLALMVVLLGAMSLIQTAGIHSIFDEPLELLSKKLGDGARGSIHPLSAGGFVLVGLALILHDVKIKGPHYPSEFLGGTVLILNAVPFVGHIFGSDMMTHFVYANQITLGSAFMFLLLGSAVLLSRPLHPLMATMTRRAPGGQMLRNSLPHTLIFLLMLDWLIDFGAKQSLYTDSAVVPILTLANFSVILLVFWRSASAVNREYEGRLQNATDLAEATSLLIAVSDNTDDAIFVKNRKGLMVFANPATLRQIGKSREEAMYRSSREVFIEQEDADKIDRDDVRIMEGGVPVILEETLHLPMGIRTFSSSKAPWFDQSGKVMGVIGISTDISKRKQIEDSLKQRESQLEATIASRTAALRQLADHMEMVREEEKRAIARELHDDMGASLTSLSMHLESAYALFPQNMQWTDRKMKMQTLFNSVVAITRRIQTELRPTMLDLFGLKAAINEQMEEFSQRTGIRCKVSLPDEDVAVGHKLEITIYRMLQETLNNTGKHAHASSVEVILDIDEDRVALTVRDDGIGIAPERKNNMTTYGLRGLNERAIFLGGTVTISENEGQGTRIMIELPLPSYAQNENNSRMQEISAMEL